MFQFQCLGIGLASNMRYLLFLLLFILTGCTAKLGVDEKIIEPIGFVVDMPEYEPETLYSRLQLLTAGGAIEREIYVVVSERTNPKNLDIITQNSNVVRVDTVPSESKEVLENEIKKDLTGKGTRFINAKQ